MAKIILSGVYEDQLAQLEKLSSSEEESPEVVIAFDDFIYLLNLRQRTAILRSLEEKGFKKEFTSMDGKEMEANIQRKLQEAGPDEKEKRSKAMKERNRDLGVVNFRERFPALLDGITPETMIHDLFEYYPEFEELLKADPNFLVVDYPSNAKSVLNLKAAAWAMTKNSDVFPVEALINPAAWLKNRNNWERGGNALQDMRYGLLSGFDRKSTESYQVRTAAVEKLERHGLEKCLDQVNNFLREGKKTEAKSLLQSLKIPQTESRALSDDEIAVITNARSCQKKLDYVVFDEDAEQRIEHDVEERTRNGGIELSKELQEAFQNMKLSTEL